MSNLITFSKDTVEVSEYMLENGRLYKTPEGIEYIINGCLYNIVRKDAHIPLKLCDSIDAALEPYHAPLEQVYERASAKCPLTFAEFEAHLIKSGVNIKTSYFILPVDFDDMATLVEIPKVLQLTGDMVPYLTQAYDDPYFFHCRVDLESGEVLPQDKRLVFHVANMAVVRSVDWKEIAQAFSLLDGEESN